DVQSLTADPGAAVVACRDAAGNEPSLQVDRLVRAAVQCDDRDRSDTRARHVEAACPSTAILSSLRSGIRNVRRIVPSWPNSSIVLWPCSARVAKTYPR